MFTVGHGARPEAALRDLLGAAGIGRLIDVRSRPGSRRHPHFGRHALARRLPEAGVAYDWWPELGGLRTPVAGSSNTALAEDAFRGYADHMATPEFAEALGRLAAAASSEPVAVMCAESDWRRCHRRMLSDALVVSGCEVRHLVDAGVVEQHVLSHELRVDGDRLVYDLPAGQSSLALDGDGGGG